METGLLLSLLAVLSFSCSSLSPRRFGIGHLDQKQEANDPTCIEACLTLRTMDSEVDTQNGEQLKSQ
jgi:hypothetical protein